MGVLKWFAAPLAFAAWAMATLFAARVAAQLDAFEHLRSDGPNEPIAVDVLSRDGTIARTAAVYMSSAEGRCVGTLVTSAGSVFEVADEWRIVSGEFRVERSVRVIHAAANDVGFRSEFAVRLPRVQKLSQVQPFVPGMWYGDDDHTPASGLIADPEQRYYLFREDRLPVPLAMIRDTQTGLTLSIRHDAPDGRTVAGDDTKQTLIDERLQFASLGVIQDRGIGVAIAFPGVEKDRSRVGGRTNGFGATERFHPVREGFTQRYRFTIRTGTQADFAGAIRDTWRAAYDAAAPKLAVRPLDSVYADSIDLLDRYFIAPKGIPGWPFSVSLPSGEIKDISYQMGFVGEQIPCAHQLIAAGFARHNPALTAKGELIVDFWAANCLTPAGLPRTWYDLDPQPHWREYKTYTRIATDGMRGMLHAWTRMKLHGRDKPQWLASCRKYGDWLVAHQNEDGSYFRQYDFDGNPSIRSKSAALHPVRFLVDLSVATGDERYLAAAKRAGLFAIREMGREVDYYGGTADNDDVKDKEAGWIAMDSFLSLYETTSDRTFRDAAERAATFTETWIYLWNVPIDRNDAKVTVPPIETTAGMSLIAVGHSGADVFLAFGPFAYYRLSLYTGDLHYAAVARLLMHNPRQLLDTDRRYGYAHPGLMTEAFGLVPERGRGVNVWLPWCTAAVLEPMLQFQDAFGTFDLDAIDRMPAVERLDRLAKNRRMISPGGALEK